MLGLMLDITLVMRDAILQYLPNVFADSVQHTATWRGFNLSEESSGAEAAKLY